MSAALEELVETLLWEGYALYPYTPGATKNATPTPFGIVYPPAYAAGSPTTFDRIRMQGIVETEPGVDAELSLRVDFLQSAGERHEGVARRVELSPVVLSALEAEGAGAEFAFDGLCGRVRMAVQRFDERLARVTLCVHNATAVAEGLDRAAALRSALLSTHVVARVAGGRFLSPVDPPEHGAAAVMACAAVNTYPVLATDQDDALLGAAIILPDHPQLAPESRGSLFDSTEIEEALLLHVLALSDGEREAIADHDPAVRAMIERAVAATPPDIAGLHGRVTVRDRAAQGSDPSVAMDARAYAGGGNGQAGEAEAVVDGVTYRPGARVRLRAEGNATAQDHLLAGRTAVVERIYIDYEDAVHLGVTLDDDPGRELMRDIGRYLYFKPADVEVLAP
jgi:hypothetical protein